MIEMTDCSDITVTTNMLTITMLCSNYKSHSPMFGLSIVLLDGIPVGTGESAK